MPRDCASWCSPCIASSVGWLSAESAAYIALDVTAVIGQDEVDGAQGLRGDGDHRQLRDRPAGTGDAADRHRQRTGHTLGSVPATGSLRSSHSPGSQRRSRSSKHGSSATLARIAASTARSPQAARLTGPALRRQRDRTAAHPVSLSVFKPRGVTLQLAQKQQQRQRDDPEDADALEYHLDLRSVRSAMLCSCSERQAAPTCIGQLLEPLLPGRNPWPVGGGVITVE
ncbi:hypothetical protein HBB16_07675 [Pseudonocardia sp. MCCB 268]|nr:hypothetical protein [Pseudonocardia cytotoxica]